MTDNRFDAYNLHKIKTDQYWDLDPHLRVLKEQPYCYNNPMIDSLPIKIPGIYTLGGARQIGKTTLLKQWISALMARGVSPERITFWAGELIDDFHALVALLSSYVAEAQNNELRYLIIDEITYIKEWDRGIKFAADAGYFHNIVLILTGSDLTLIQAARMTFPGRRGKADKVDFHLYSLSFREFVKLKKVINHLDDICAGILEPDEMTLDKIYHEFNEYLKHGGYLSAMNDLAQNNKITESTLKTYSDWIRGDVLKRGKQEQYLKEILAAIIERYNKQVTWHNIADVLSIDSPKTIADYCELLSSMDALFIQSALIEDKLVGAPKKARKLTFTDPFIYHALKQWLIPIEDPYERILQDVHSSVISSDLVEAVVSNHYARIYPTYYIKGEGEIDIAYIDKNTFWPIEIKWRNQLRPRDLKSLKKYNRSRVYSKTRHSGKMDGISLLPLPLALLRLP